jgi:hypothetical protein
MKHTLRLLALSSAFLVGVSGISRAASVDRQPPRPEKPAVSILLRLREWILPLGGDRKPDAKIRPGSRRHTNDCLNGHEIPPSYGCPPY